MVFGFVEGGSMYASVSVSPPPPIPNPDGSTTIPFMWSMVCSDAQLNRLLDFNTKEDLCAANITDLW